MLHKNDEEQTVMIVEMDQLQYFLGIYCVEIEFLLNLVFQSK